MGEITLQVSPNLWNVLKFLLFEFIISVLIRGSYIQLLRTVGSRSFNGNHAVSIVGTRLGRLTPYEFVWWKVGNSRTGTLIPKLFLVSLNVFLLALALMAEFGSGSTADVRIVKGYCYGRRSELLTRRQSLSLEQYIALNSVMPEDGCVHQNTTGRYLMPTYPNRTCPASYRDEQSEGILIRGCSTLPGKIITRVCSMKEQHELFGTTAVGSAEWDTILPRFKVSSVEPLPYSLVQPLFYKRTPIRALVRGMVHDAVVVRGNETTTVKTEPRELTCYARTKNMKEHNVTIWSPYSCYFVHDGMEVLYAVHHKYKDEMQIIQINHTTSKGNTTKPGDILLTAPIPKQIIVRPMADKNWATHRGALLYISEVLSLRTRMHRLSSNIRIDLEKHVVDDIVVRLYGFMNETGGFSCTHKAEASGQVAIINFWFIGPIALLVALALLQQILSMRERPTEVLPCSIEEAVNPNNILHSTSGTRCIDSDGRTLTFQRFMHWKMSPRQVTEEFVDLERQQYLANQQPG